MKKVFSFHKRQCSDFDDRPIFDPEDNLYHNSLDNSCYEKNKCSGTQNKKLKKDEIIKNNEKTREN